MKRLLFSMAAVSMLIAGSNATFAQSNRWRSFLEVEGRAGDGPERAQTRSFLPIFQDSSSLIFGDIRSTYSDNDAWEGNFGVGYRQILSSNRIFGVYGFYDVLNSTNSNTYHQGSAGVELLDINWGLRANGYIPNDKRGVAAGGVAFLQGNQIVVQGNQERAYYGMDIEAEHVLWRNDSPIGVLGNCDFEVWAAGGYYHFDNSTSGFESISGPRARVEARLYDLPYLGNDSRLVVTGQYEHDDVRGSVGQGFLSVRIPFGLGGCDTCRPKLNLLDRRMVTPVVRDIDIVTNVAASGPTELAVNSKTRTVLNDIVTLTAADDILAEIEGGPDGRTFILDGIDGPEDINADDIDLNDGQILIGGGGSMLVEGMDSGLLATFTAAGDRFTINQLDGGTDVITLGLDNGIYGLTLTGGLDTISGTNPGMFEIAGNTLMNSSDELIDLDIDVTGTVGCILNNHLIANGIFGDSEAIDIDAFGEAELDLTIIGNTFEMIGSDGILIDLDDDANVIVDIHSNHFFGNGNDGVEFQIDDTASLMATITDNLFDDVDDDAIEIDADNSTILDVIIAGNTILGRDNTSDGIDIELDDAANLALLVADNIFDDVNSDAIEIDADDDTILDVIIAGNSILGRGNTFDGIDISGSSDEGDLLSITTVIENNIFQDIRDDGIFLDVDDNGVMNTTIANNEFLRIAGDGIEVSVEDHDDGDITQNTFIFDNRFVDVGVDADGFDTGGAGIRIETNDNDSDDSYLIAQTTTIAGNTFLRNGTGIALQFDSDSDSDGGQYVSITSIYENKFLNTVTDGINLDVQDFDGEDLSIVLNIEENLFRNTGEDAIDLSVMDTDTDSGIVEFETLIAGNRFYHTGDTAIRIDVDDETELDADILDNHIRNAWDGINIFNGDETSDATIGGNVIRRIDGTGIILDADADLFLDDNGQNNTVRVKAGGTIFDIDDDGDVQGTIEINNVDQVFP